MRPKIRMQLLRCGHSSSLSWQPPAGRRATTRSSATQRDLRSGDVDRRVAAVKRLQDQPLPENAKLLRDRRCSTRCRGPQGGLRNPPGLERPTRNLRPAAKTPRREVHSKKGRPALIEPLVAVLLASEIPEIQRDVKQLIDGRLASSADGPATLIAVADALGKQGDHPAVAVLRE